MCVCFEHAQNKRTRLRSHYALTREVYERSTDVVGAQRKLHERIEDVSTSHRALHERIVDVSTSLRASWAFPKNTLIKSPILQDLCLSNCLF